MIRNHLMTRHGAVAGVSLAIIAALCLSPSLLGDRVSEAVSGLGAADPASLWVAGLAFARNEPLWRSRLAGCAPSEWLAVAFPRRIGSVCGGLRRQRDRARSCRIGSARGALRPCHEGWLLDRRWSCCCGRRDPNRLARCSHRDGKRGRCAAPLAAVRDRGDRGRGNDRCRRLTPLLTPRSTRSDPRSVQVASLLATRSRDRCGLGTRGCRRQGGRDDRSRSGPRDRQPTAGCTRHRAGRRACRDPAAHTGERRDCECRRRVRPRALRASIRRLPSRPGSPSEQSSSSQDWPSEPQARSRSPDRGCDRMLASW